MARSMVQPAIMRGKVMSPHLAIGGFEEDDYRPWAMICVHTGHLDARNSNPLVEG